MNTPGQLRSSSNDVTSVNTAAVAAAVVVLVVAVVVVAAISGCVSKAERHEVYAGSAPPTGTHRQGSADTASSVKTKKPAQKPAQKSTGNASSAERVRKLPNKKQAFKHPVTRLDAEDDDDADGAIVGENGGNASAGKKSAEQPAQKATPSKESAANSVNEDDSPLTLSAGTRRRRSVTRARSGSSPALSKAAAPAAQTSKSPGSAARSPSGVRRLRSATATARPSARPAPLGSPAGGGDAPVVARKMRSKSVAAPSKKQMLLQWCRSRIEPHAQALDVKPNFPRNFSKAWKSGKALIGILYDVDPSSVPLARVLAMTPAQRLEFGFALAESRYGVSRVLDVEDITDFPKPDDKCVMLYVSMLHKGVSRM